MTSEAVIQQKVHKVSLAPSAASLLPKMWKKSPCRTNHSCMCGTCNRVTQAWGNVPVTPMIPSHLTMNANHVSLRTQQLSLRANVRSRSSLASSHDVMIAVNCDYGVARCPLNMSKIRATSKLQQLWKRCHQRPIRWHAIWPCRSELLVLWCLCVAHKLVM